MVDNKVVIPEDAVLLCPECHELLAVTLEDIYDETPMDEGAFAYVADFYDEKICPNCLESAYNEFGTPTFWKDGKEYGKPNGA